MIDKSVSNKQVLDHLPVERERGITVKAQTATMFYTFRGEQYMLNLIDTPVRQNFLLAYNLMCVFRGGDNLAPQIFHTHTCSIGSVRIEVALTFLGEHASRLH